MRGGSRSGPLGGYRTGSRKTRIISAEAWLYQSGLAGNKLPHSKLHDFALLPSLSLEELVPNDNFYRRLDRKLDLSFVGELVKDCYASSGRPNVDPVVFHLQLVMFFEDIRCERRLMEVAAAHLSIRWHLGFDLHEPLPDHSSLTLGLGGATGSRCSGAYTKESLRVLRGGAGVGQGALLRCYQGQG